MLLGRLSHLERNVMLNTIDSRDENLERNKIIDSAMSLGEEAGLLPKGRTQTPPPPPITDNGGIDKNTLLTIIRENRRRRPDYTKKVSDFLAEYNTYTQQKETLITFDPVGRRFKALKETYNLLLSELEEDKDKGLEDICAKVDDLLSAPCPTYDDLNKAYDLVCGRGFVDDWIAINLKNRPSDNETRFAITDRIEAYTASIRRK